MIYIDNDNDGADDQAQGLKKMLAGSLLYI